MWLLCVSMSTAFDVAWSLLKSDIMVRKNVIGMQDGTQYKMPPAIASMAQRPQQPEMMTQQMEVQQQQPGFFGRFRQPTTTMQSTQVPTGANVVGRRPDVFPLQDGPMQTNSPHPLGAVAASPAPGAQVTRMPRPGPFMDGPYGVVNSYDTYAPNVPSLSNFRGVHHLASDVRPIGNHAAQGTRGNQHTQTGDGRYMTAEERMQDYHGDQFGPARSFQ